MGSDMATIGQRCKFQSLQAPRGSINTLRGRSQFHRLGCCPPVDTPVLAIHYTPRTYDMAMTTTAAQAFAQFPGAAEFHKKIALAEQLPGCHPLALGPRPLQPVSNLPRNVTATLAGKGFVQRVSHVPVVFGRSDNPATDLKLGYSDRILPQHAKVDYCAQTKRFKLFCYSNERVYVHGRPLPNVREVVVLSNGTPIRIADLEFVFYW